MQPPTGNAVVTGGTELVEIVGQAAQGRGRAASMVQRAAAAGKPPLSGTGGAAKELVAEAQRPAAATQEENDEELKQSLKQQVLEITAKVEEMERQVTEVARMRATLLKTKALNNKASSNAKDRDKDKAASNKKQQQLEASRRDAARTKRMTELMRQLGTVLRQITQHKWAWPFMEPVDVQGLGLHDYYDIIKKPMDLGTIRDRMDAKDGTGYKHVQEICDDIRLVFRNAMAYNQDGTDVHVMAKTLSEKFEEKWRTVLEPKLQEEDTKRKQEEKEANSKEVAAMQAAEEKLAVDVAQQLEELDKQLEELKQKATPKCRVMSIEEKRQLGHSLGRLPADNLQRVIQIIAQKNPGFNASADEVEVDIDAQEPATLWRLHRYVQSVMNFKSRAVGNSPASNKRGAQATIEKIGAKRGRKVSSP
ncbi:hypothetical protein R1sor_010305 [Riccia sorocarpa]|uniref:Transcription factor GTE6 n=1 Tax=Riccia sorocarpa TaxID=122646 RepID=A0ABD3I3Q7_9MARC